jgi:hypothetical protein
MVTYILHRRSCRRKRDEMMGGEKKEKERKVENGRGP